MILKYKRFLESKGTPDVVIPYISHVLDMALDRFRIFMKSEEEPFIERRVIPKEEIVKWMDPEDWKKLPVSELDLEIKFNKDNNEDLEKKFYTTGWCFNMDEKDGSRLKEDGSIFLRVIVGGEITPDYLPEDFDRFKLDLESTIYHEFNHAYESYNRKIKGYPPLQDALTLSVDTNVENVHEDIWEIWWDEIGFYLYWTESQEMNAIVQELLPYTKTHDLDWVKSHHHMWDNIQKMLKFRASRFKAKLSRIIRKNTKEKPIELMTRMKNGIAKRLEEEMEKRNERNPSLTPQKIRNMTIDQFLKFCERRFTHRAEILRRKILRNYTR